MFKIVGIPYIFSMSTMQYIYFCFIYRSTILGTIKHTCIFMSMTSFNQTYDSLSKKISQKIPILNQLNTEKEAYFLASHFKSKKIMHFMGPINHLTHILQRHACTSPWTPRESIIREKISRRKFSMNISCVNWCYDKIVL